MLQELAKLIDDVANDSSSRQSNLAKMSPSLALALSLPLVENGVLDEKTKKLIKEELTAKLELDASSPFLKVEDKGLEQRKENQDDALATLIKSPQSINKTGVISKEHKISSKCEFDTTILHSFGETSERKKADLTITTENKIVSVLAGGSIGFLTTSLITDSDIEEITDGQKQTLKQIEEQNMAKSTLETVFGAARLEELKTLGLDDWYNEVKLLTLKNKEKGLTADQNFINVRQWLIDKHTGSSDNPNLGLKINEDIFDANLTSLLENKAVGDSAIQSFIKEINATNFSKMSDSETTKMVQALAIKNKINLDSLINEAKQSTGTGGSTAESSNAPESAKPLESEQMPDADDLKNKMLKQISGETDSDENKTEQLDENKEKEKINEDKLPKEAEDEDTTTTTLVSKKFLKKIQAAARNASLPDVKITAGTEISNELLAKLKLFIKKPTNWQDFIEGGELW